MTQLVQLEAYLGPDKPETLAEGIFQVRDGDEYKYAVVVQQRDSGETRLAAPFYEELYAAAVIDTITDSRQFGILCVVRQTVVEREGQTSASN
jgi:hypothetical protein